MNCKPCLPRGPSHGSAGRAILAIVFIATLVHPVSAETSFVLASTRGSPGATVSVPVILRGETNVVALQADVLFDSSSLFSGAVAAGGAAANHVVATTAGAPRVRRLLCYSLGNAPLSNGVIATLDFTVPVGTVQNALRLSLSNVLLVTAAPAAVP